MPMTTGRMNTWATYMRDQNDGSPGKGWPQISRARLAPSNGIDRATEYPIASPMPESRSSAIE